jgi:DNA-binding helix-hairpin-helix protein with protein kinase domain
MREFVIHCQRFGAIRLGPGDFIASGGEGSVYRVPVEPGTALKVFSNPDPRREWKLQRLREVLASGMALGTVPAAGPIALAYADAQRSRLAGFFMREVVGSRPLFEIYIPAFRKQSGPVFDFRHLVRTGRRLAEAVDRVHSLGLVIGDLNESNVLVSSSGEVTLIDVDSWQVRHGTRCDPCRVGKPDLLAPELHGVDLDGVIRSPDQDAFALAVLIHKLLREGMHPFDGVWKGSDEVPGIEWRIRGGWYPFGPTRRHWGPVPHTLPLRRLFRDVATLTNRCFIEGHDNPSRRPRPADWIPVLQALEDSLIPCRNNSRHWHPRSLKTCPWCRRARRLQGLDLFGQSAVHPGSGTANAGSRLQHASEVIGLVVALLAGLWERLPHALARLNVFCRWRPALTRWIPNRASLRRELLEALSGAAIFVGFLAFWTWIRNRGL